MNTKSLIAALTLGSAALAHAGPILIVNGASTSSEPGTTSAVTTNLSNLHVLAGNTVTVADSLPASLAAYSQVWDVRFDTALDAAASAEYASYLGAGGGLFLMGENASFMARNNSILSLIASLGGGGVGFSSCYDGIETVRAPFTGPNAVSQVNYAASGCFTNHGTGQWITARADDSVGAGIAFGVGSLSGAASGALTSILDVNFMMNQYDLPASQNLTKNLIGFVGDQVDPPNGVPEPGTLTLVGLAALGAFAARRRQLNG